MKYIIAIGVFQAVISVVLLCTNKLRSKGDVLLILLLISIATHLGIKFFIYNFINDAEVRFQMNTFIGLCYGPLLYLYARKKKDPFFIPASQWYVFLPVIAGAIGYLTVICVLNISVDIGYRVLHLYNNTSVYFFVACLVYFSWKALQIARKHLSHLPQEQRLISKVGSLFLLLAMVSVMMLVMVRAGIEHIDIIGRSVVYFFLSITCFIIIRLKYAGIIERSSAEAYTKEVYHSPAPVPVLHQEPIFVSGEVTEKKTLLTKEEHHEIWEKLETYLQKTKVYTDSDLNMDMLAKNTGVNKHHISETLNNFAKKSFYQYINEYRIRHIISKMQFMNEKELPVNMLSLAYDGGFKAKSSFNQYFKKITGQTPTEYLKSFSEKSWLLKCETGDC